MLIKKLHVFIRNNAIEFIMVHDNLLDVSLKSMMSNTLCSSTLLLRPSGEKRYLWHYNGNHKCHVLSVIAHLLFPSWVTHTLRLHYVTAGISLLKFNLVTYCLVIYVFVKYTLCHYCAYDWKEFIRACDQGLKFSSSTIDLFLIKDYLNFHEDRKFTFLSYCERTRFEQTHQQIWTKQSTHVQTDILGFHL